MFMIRRKASNDMEGLNNELVAKFFHGLSNPARFRIALALLDIKKNVSELVNELGMKQSQISNQLVCLRWCGYVSVQKEGKFIYYQITDERVRQIIKLARQIVADNAEQIKCCTRM
jgi:DNA-binding transcriptional ArsR family regulator